MQRSLIRREGQNNLRGIFILQKQNIQRNVKSHCLSVRAVKWCNFSSKNAKTCTSLVKLIRLLESCGFNYAKTSTYTFFLGLETQNFYCELGKLLHLLQVIHISGLTAAENIALSFFISSINEERRKQ